jgi:hypothetical protein
VKFLFSFLVSLLLAGCWWRTEPVPPNALSWANSYYAANPVANVNAAAGGWLFRGARDYKGELRVGYLIPEAMSGEANRRRAVLSQACPPRNADIWRLLPKENKLVIIVWTRDNKFKDDVVCSRP